MLTIGEPGRIRRHSPIFGRILRFVDQDRRDPRYHSAVDRCERFEPYPGPPGRRDPGRRTGDLDPRRDGFMLHGSVRPLESRREDFDRMLMSLVAARRMPVYGIGWGCNC